MNLKRKSLFSALVAPVAGVPLRAAGLVLALSTLAGQAPAAELPVLSVQTAHRAHTATYDGQVEALRQSAIAAQVPGTVLELNVRAGDAVRAGQVLLRIDARAPRESRSACAPRWPAPTAR